MRRSFVSLSLLALVSCNNGLGPAADISGTWTASRVEYRLTLDLVQQGSSVSGTGDSWGFINPPNHQYTVTGTYALPTATLTLTRDDSVVSVFTGTVLDAHRMIRVQSFGDSSDTLTFRRQ
jgi:hypothetical protein